MNLAQASRGDCPPEAYVQEILAQQLAAQPSMPATAHARGNSAWLDSLPSSRTRFPVADTISREMIYQDHD